MGASHDLRAVFALCALSAAGAFGSTIFGGSTTTSTGLTYTVSVTDFTTSGADMAGIVVTANFSSGGPISCTWTSAGSCTSAGSEFTVSYPVANSTHPQVNNSNWTITNNYTGFTMTSITFNGIPGLTAFDRCMTGSSTFDDTNPGGLGDPGGDCDATGTTGSDIGYSVGNGTIFTGTSGINGTVQYMNALHLVGESPVGDWWGQFTITFGGTAFTSGSNFTFRSDSDTLSSAVLDVAPSSTPEPSTFALAGLALIGLSFVRRK